MVCQILRALFCSTAQERVEKLADRLQARGWDVEKETCSSADELAEALRAEHWDVVIVADPLPEEERLRAVRIVRERAPETPCVVVTDSQDDAAAKNLLEAGAVDCVRAAYLVLLPQAVEHALLHGEEWRRRREAERRVQHLNSVLRAVRDIDKIITRARDPRRMLRRACAILTKVRGYNTAWVLAVDEEGRFRLAEQDGFGEEFFHLREMLEQNEWPACARRAMAKPSDTVVLDPRRDCGDCPLAREPWTWQSLCVCLHRRGQCSGVLVVSRSDQPPAGEGEFRLLEEIAGDLAFAIHALDLEAESRRRQQALETTSRFLQIANQHTLLKPLLRAWVAEVKAYTGCEAVGIRLLDEEGRIPYEAYVGFSERFYESESALCIHSDSCMCVNVIKGETDSSLPFFTEKGSFYCNSTTRLLRETPAEKRGRTRNVCNEFGYESVALVPVRTSEDVLGLIQVADPRENRLPLEMVETLERIADALAGALDRIRSLEHVRHLSHIVHSADDAIISTRLDGAVIAWNLGAERLYGYKASEIVGKSVELLFPPERREEFEQARERLRRGERIPAHETVRMAQDGRRIDVEVSITPLRDEEGRLCGSFGFHRDITPRKRAQRELQEARAFAESVVNTVREPLVVLDKNLRVVSANRSFYEMFRTSPSDTEGQRFYELGERQWDAPDLRALLERVLPEEICIEGFEVEHEFEGVGRRFMVVNAQRLRTPDNADERILVAIEDVTERKLLEQQLRQAAKMEAIGRLAGGVAHDFNNLLTGIKGYTEILMGQAPKDSPMQDDLKELQSLTERAANLTRQLLAFSRKQTMRMQVVNLNDLIGNLLKMLRRLIGEDIELAFYPAEDLGNVRADPGQIEQVLMNLAVNAKDAMPDGGRLTIETANVFLDKAYADRHVGVTPGAYVMFAVTDTGCGMDEETLSKVFDPFFTTKEVGKGTGLGLSTVYGIVKQHGGNVWAYSEVGKGSSFKVYLPRVDELEQALPEAVDMTAMPSGSETILIVEDETAVRDIAARLLEEQGYKVLCAASPNEAERLLDEREEPIDLLLTDVVLPGCSGRKLHERLSARHGPLKVVYMSGYSENAIVHHGMLDPGVPFIQKPFDGGTLLREIRKVLDEASPP